MTATPGMARAARRAALKVEALILEMLAANQQGSVSVEVGYAGLQPVKRVDERKKLIKVSKGRDETIETAE